MPNSQDYICLCDPRPGVDGDVHRPFRITPGTNVLSYLPPSSSLHVYTEKYIRDSPILIKARQAMLREIGLADEPNRRIVSACPAPDGSRLTFFEHWSTPLHPDLANGDNGMAVVVGEVFHMVPFETVSLLQADKADRRTLDRCWAEMDASRKARREINELREKCALFGGFSTAPEGYVLLPWAKEELDEADYAYICAAEGRDRADQISPNIEQAAAMATMAALMDDAGVVYPGGSGSSG